MKTENKHRLSEIYKTNPSLDLQSFKQEGVSNV